MVRERRRKLSKGWGFVCCCRKCTREGKTDGRVEPEEVHGTMGSEIRNGG